MIKVFTKDFNYSPTDLHEEASWIEVWDNLDEKQILKWKNEYGISHVIREVELPLSFKIIYINKKFIVYQI